MIIIVNRHQPVKCVTWISPTFEMLLATLDQPNWSYRVARSWSWTLENRFVSSTRRLFGPIFSVRWNRFYPRMLQIFLLPVGTLRVWSLDLDSRRVTRPLMSFRAKPDGGGQNAWWQGEWVGKLQVSWFLVCKSRLHREAIRVWFRGRNLRAKAMVTRLIVGGNVGGMRAGFNHIIQIYCRIFNHKATISCWFEIHTLLRNYYIKFWYLEVKSERYFLFSIIYYDIRLLNTCLKSKQLDEFHLYLLSIFCFCKSN